MNDNIKKVLELLQDKEQVEKIDKIGDFSEFLQYLESQGIALSDKDNEELAEIMSKLRNVNDSELDSKELSDVTGGSALTDFGGAILGPYGALIGEGIKYGKRLADKYYKWEQNGCKIKGKKYC